LIVKNILQAHVVDHFLAFIILAIALSVLRFTPSNYHCGIFKLFIQTWTGPWIVVHASLNLMD